MSLSSLEAPLGGGDGFGISPVFWGCSIGTASGTGTCYREAPARHYIFWIGGATTTKYRYADCATGVGYGEWVDSLMGEISTIQE